MSFDKKAINEEARNEAAAEAKIPELDPAFPYRVLPFDPLFFEIPADPQKEIEEASKTV